MNRIICLILLLLGLIHIPTAHADGLKDDLDHRYKHHVLALRYPLVRGDQNFDSAGHPLSNPSEAWWVYGAIFVDDLRLSSNTLQVEGPRVALTPPKGNEKTVAVPVGKPLKVEIHLDRPLGSIDEAESLLNRVFYLLGDDPLLHTKPEYRRADEATVDESTYKISNLSEQHIKAPQAKYTPEPEFSEQARRAQREGVVILSVVIDKNGNVSRIRIEKPAGMGLDENAVEAVKQWRFSPAMRDGEPVPVEMKIEVSFNLGQTHLRR